MGITQNDDYLLHSIRIRLYPNYLNAEKGKYIARTINEKSLSIEDVCKVMQTRGGFMGNYEDLLHNIHAYYEEAAYQLADGYAIDNGYYSIHLNIGGTFNNHKDVKYVREANPISFRFSTRRKLHDLLEKVSVVVDGLADVSGGIGEFHDVKSGIVNKTISPGGIFAIYGNKIKVVGDDPSVGVYFVSVADPALEIKVSDNFAENTNTKLIGIIPALVNDKQWQVAVKTQFTGSSNKFLKTPRIITNDSKLEVA